MIFVTVGTHEQQFNRLIEEIDNLKGNGIIKDEVFIQTGYSDYVPKYCKYKNMISYNDMIKTVKEARIVITHGGPSSFISVLQNNKIPIVVPRQHQYLEHVNDHQVEFVKEYKERINNIIPIYDIKELKNKIINYDKLSNKLLKNNLNNNKKFCIEFEKIVNELFE